MAQRGASGSWERSLSDSGDPGGSMGSACPVMSCPCTQARVFAEAPMGGRPLGVGCHWPSRTRQVRPCVKDGPWRPGQQVLADLRGQGTSSTSWKHRRRLLVVRPPPSGKGLFPGRRCVCPVCPVSRQRTALTGFQKMCGNDRPCADTMPAVWLLLPPPGRGCLGWAGGTALPPRDTQASDVRGPIRPGKWLRDITPSAMRRCHKRSRPHAPWR